MTDPRKPVHSRDAQGRYRVDLRQIRSPLLKYGLALGVLAGVLWLARRFPSGHEIPDATLNWLIPYVGGAVVIVVVVGVLLSRFGRR